MFVQLRNLSGNTGNTQEVHYYDVKQFLNNPVHVSVTSKVQMAQLLLTTIVHQTIDICIKQAA